MGILSQIGWVVGKMLEAVESAKQPQICTLCAGQQRDPAQENGIWCPVCNGLGITQHN